MGPQGVLLLLASMIALPSAVMADSDIFKKLEAKDSYSTLVSLLKEVGLDKKLDDGKYTIFAPSNTVLSKFSKETVKCLTETDKGKKALSKILKFHIVKKRLKKLKPDECLETLNDKKDYTVRKDGAGRLIIDGVYVVKVADLESDNGVVHQIDGILIPANVDLGKACPGSGGDEINDGGYPSPNRSPGRSPSAPTDNSTPRSSGSFCTWTVVVALLLCLTQLVL